MSHEGQPNRGAEEQEFGIVDLAAKLTEFRRESLYERLELPSTASSEQVKAAYKAFQRKYHPDLHGQKSPAQREMIGEMAHLISECVILTDERKRRYYDQALAAGRGGQSSSSQPEPAPSPHSPETNAEEEKVWFEFFEDELKHGEEFLQDSFSEFEIEFLRSELAKIAPSDPKYSQAKESLESTIAGRPFYLRFRKKKGWGEEKPTRREQAVARAAEKEAAILKDVEGNLLETQYESINKIAGSCLDCSNRSGDHHLFLRQADGKYKRYGISRKYHTILGITTSAGNSYVMAKSYSARTGDSLEVINPQSGQNLGTYSNVTEKAGKVWGTKVVGGQEIKEEII